MGLTPTTLESIWTNSTLSENEAKEHRVPRTNIDAGRLRNIQPFTDLQRHVVQSGGGTFVVIQHQDFSRKRFERRRFEEGGAGAATPEEESNFACGLKTEISICTYA